MSRLLSGLVLVRVTAAYSVMLILVAAALVVLGPQAQCRVIDQLSTNLHNLARGPVGTLIGSAFVTGDDRVYVWLPGLACLLALGELLWRGKGVVVAFTVGHVGATLIIAAVLATAIVAGWLPASIAGASDVGISYGAAAVLGTLTAAIPTWWRLAWVCFWLVNAVLVATSAGGFDFTAVGHVVALALGILLSTRFRLLGSHWTPLRLVLLASAVAFGYNSLIGFSVVGTPVVGLATALIALAARAAAHRWRSRERSRSVAPPDRSGALAV
ncbi:rhomboid-like protein [Mycobacterium sp. JS623]|uniref:rhomboid-like protein n=1 Tax=Mycobacterium sp. JS623 TaxID=212767 RepID=UPI0012FB52B7|nr:rhomboid-like protein [Mycobacterium sp. JS623]